MHYVYLVQCADGTLYGGWTRDLQKRLAAHNAGTGAKYTRSRRPVALVYWEELEEKAAALSREWQLKHLSRKEKLAMIQSQPKIRYRAMAPGDLPRLAGLYAAYYNAEGGCWTEKTAEKRIFQVLKRPDSLCLVLEIGGQPAGLALGCLEQYDDLSAFDLVEILVDRPFQGQGVGSAFLQECERRAKARGAGLVQLQSVADEAHQRFYQRAGYRDAVNLRLKTKSL